jgi:hypothetical protein
MLIKVGLELNFTYSIAVITFYLLRPLKLTYETLKKFTNSGKDQPGL